MDPINVINSLSNKFDKNLKITFLGTFIFGYIVHGYILVNKLVKSDDMAYFYLSKEQYNFGAKNGRWLSFINLLSGNLSNPWVIGFITILFISISACIVCKCLKINTLFYNLLLGAVFIAFPAVASMLTYTFMADTFAISLFFSCFAVWISIKYKKRFYFAVIPLVLSLAIYQAYISLTISIYISILIFSTIDKDKTFKDIIKIGLQFSATLTASTILYIILTRYVINYKLSSYQGIADMGEIQISALPIMIQNAYKCAYQLFMTDYLNLNFLYIKYLYSFGLFVLIAVIMALVIKNNSYQLIKIIFLIILLLLFPLACNFPYLMGSPNTWVHMLMKFSNVMFFVFILKILDLSENIRYNRKILNYTLNLSKWFLLIIVILGIHNYYIIDNNTYLREYMAYEQGYAYSNRLILRIEDLDSYTIDSKILFIEKPNSKFTMNSEFSGTNSINIYGYDILTMDYYKNFLKYFMGFPNSFVSLSTAKKTAPDIEKEITKMPLYPSQGSIQMIEDIIVVKFREPSK